jgi:anti-sigma factor RsiW
MTTPRERIDALLVDEVTDGLDATARAELEALLAEHPDVDRYGFERVAAAVFLTAGATLHERMPATLRSKLTVAAERALARG